jgi:hypothetical protein
MKICGFLEPFWVVTKPSPASGMEDICFSCTVEGLMRQARGGLDEDDIVGVYANETEARQAAGRLLGEYPVRSQDALAVDVVVHVMVTPRSEQMTARELGEAAVEAVRDAVRDAERRGHRHRLADQVTLGMSEVVELHNRLTAVG